MNKNLLLLVLASLLSVAPVQAFADTVTGKVVAFNTVKRTVIIKTDDGKRTAVYYRNPKDIMELKTGQKVEITTSGAGKKLSIQSVKVIEISEGEKVSRAAKDAAAARGRK